MNARKRNILLVSFVAIAAIAAAATSMAGLLDLFTTNQPVRERVRMTSSGIELRHDFRVTEECSYEFNLWLLHKQNKMGELDAVLVNYSLPISVTTNVYRLHGERADPVAQLSGAPRRHGKSPGMTNLLIGRVRLDEGHYRVELSSEGEAPQLEGIDMELVVQPRPKTSC
jgi:hypothetical protein